MAPHIQASLPAWPPVRTVEAPSFLRSMGWALLLEIILLGIGAAVLMHTPARVVTKEPVMLAIDEPVLTKPREQPKPQPKVRMKAAPLPPPRVQPVTPPPPTVTPPEVKPLVNPPPAEIPFAQTIKPPPPPPPPSSAAAQAEADFAGRIKQAIQAAIAYPMAAKAMGIQGEPVVGFDFLDGAVSNIHIITGSGNAAIDRAGMAAVADARYPTPPESLRGKQKSYEVTVTFHLF